MPAVALNVGDGAGGNHNRTDPFFGRTTRVAGQPFYHHMGAIGPRGPHTQLFRRAAIPVKGQLGIAQRCEIDKFGPLQPNLFLDKPTKGQRRVGQLLFKDLQRRAENRRRTGTVIRT